MPKQILTEPKELSATKSVAGGLMAYLVFEVARSSFALPVSVIREIVLLPELQPALEQPPFVVGLTNLRGAVFPVIDLQLRLGQKPTNYTVDDHMLVLERGGKKVALVVNQVLGVKRIDDSFIDSASSEPGTLSGQRFVTGTARVDERIVLMLDAKALTEIGEYVALTMGAVPTPFGSFSEAAEEDQLEFAERSRSLTQSIGKSTDSGALSMAVVELDGEFFAMEFSFIHEFFEAAIVTPVPCCPDYVLGNVNLRGEILTIIDIRERLNLAPIAVGSSGKIVVVEHEGLRVGLHVDAFHDVCEFKEGEEQSLSSTHLNRHGNLKGVVPFRVGYASLLALDRLLKLENWIVNEAVRA